MAFTAAAVYIFLECLVLFISQQNRERGESRVGEGRADGWMDGGSGIWKCLQGEFKIGFPRAGTVTEGGMAVQCCGLHRDFSLS